VIDEMKESGNGVLHYFRFCFLGRGEPVSAVAPFMEPADRAATRSRALATGIAS